MRGAVFNDIPVDRRDSNGDWSDSVEETGAIVVYKSKTVE